MFGHLKPADFTNLIEGMAIAPRRHAHLEKCGRCREQLQAVEEIHKSVASLEDEALEPDWSEFRAGVREGMLARSATRTAEARRWRAWRLAPAGVSLAAALAAGLLLNYRVSEQGQNRRFVDPQPQPPDDLDIEKAVWVRTSAYEAAITLNPEESERFRQLLENEALKAAQTDAGSTPEK
jgi:hypothetical protein